MEIYIYEQNANDLDSAGLCGALMPSVCRHEEQAGGMSELVIEHPRDEWGKWRYIEAGRIIKAPVPVRTVPPIEDGELIASVTRGRIRDTATKAQRTMWSKRKNGKKVGAAALGATVTVVKNPAGGDRYGIRGAKKSGWVDKAAVELLDPVAIPATPQGIEEVEAAWSVRDQFFRIYEYERSDSGVTAKARHIQFDLLGNLTLYSTEDPVTLGDALDGVLSGTVMDTDFEGFTDIRAMAAGFDAARVNPIKAIADPEAGLVSRWGGELVRDNYEIYILSRAGLNRGVRIEYGKNLLGVQCNVTHEPLVTRVLPVGEGANGDPVYLTGEAGKVGKQITEASYITSAGEGAFSVPHITVLQVSDAKMSAKGVTQAVAAARMREAAQSLLDGGADMPVVQMKVDFVRLGDTEEYRQFAGLDDVFLYDTVRVEHRELGISMDVDVVRVVFDCLTGKYAEIELGALRDSVNTMASWQIPSISGGKILLGTIGSGQMRDGAISARVIQAEAVLADHIAANQIETRHLTAGSITAEQINAESLFAQNIVAAVAKIIEANIGKAQIGDAEIDWAKIIDLKAVFADVANVVIGTADIDYARIRDLVTGTAIISEGVAGKLFMSRLAVTEANMVSLTVGELIVKGEDGSFYRFSVGEDGEVLATVVQVEGDNIANGTITGGKIIESSITTRELNVDQIFASEALIGKITAANIAVNTITPAHVVAGFGSALDISGNVALRSIVSADAVREMIDGGTRELRVSYGGAGTHLTADGERTVMSARVYESGEDVTAKVPATSFVWTRDSGNAAADAAWAAQHVGVKQIMVGQEDIMSRSIIACSLLAIGETMLEFAGVSGSMDLTVTNPPYGLDTASYDVRTGVLTIDGDGYQYDSDTGMLTMNNGLSSSRATAQFTFSDETGVRSMILQLSDRISLIVEDGGGGSAELRLTPKMIAAMSKEIVLDGRVGIGALDQGVMDKFAAMTAAADAAKQLANGAQGTADTAKSSAATAQSAAGAAQAAASAAQGTANTLQQRLINLCITSDMTYINGAKIYTGSITADKINTNNLYAYRLRDPAVDANSWIQLTSKKPDADEDNSRSSMGMAVYLNGVLNGQIGAVSHPIFGQAAPQPKNLTLSASTNDLLPVGVLGSRPMADTQIRLSVGVDPVETAAGYRTRRLMQFAVAPLYITPKGGEPGRPPAMELYCNIDTDNQGVYVNGNIRYTGTIAASSDIRHKKDVSELTNLAFLDSLKPISYRFIADDRKAHWGLSAQDVRQSLADCQEEDAAILDDDLEGNLALSYTELIAPLIAGYQAHGRRIYALEEENRELKGRLGRLESMMGVT